MSYHCEVKAHPTHSTLYIRRKTPIEQLGQATCKVCGVIKAYLDDIHEKPSGSPYILYHNRDVKTPDCEIGIQVSHPIEGKGEICAGLIPASVVATCVYTGPYDQIGIAYEALTCWIREHHYQVTGAAYEEYLNVSDKTSMQTRIIFPVKAA